ncbi:hypothetical protein RHGRI_019651 [Rhododendron griersonianum]|uniref:RNA-dependent RNA polymerase n=1 Tax=Rhododendron griersonianum TaxID=479676 RepID=A0AAV6JH87_9ERIC|nr:hypothetical protein RHGRI_019651 [Rhododendron griersonianum]
MAPGENTNILKEMLLCGYKPDAEPFLSMMLQTFRAAKLLEIRTKTKVFVPGGRSMMGCLDETKTLEYGQVFVQISGASNVCSRDNSRLMPNGIDSDQGICLGKVFVAKNPCLHPGDIRVLRAVNVPALHHMVDCVVFPQKGMRPHPNECSGSDLDGDVYFVCWDQDLIPPKQIPPMDYTPAPTKLLDHDVSMEVFLVTYSYGELCFCVCEDNSVKEHEQSEDAQYNMLPHFSNEVEEYFTDYIVNDSLGIIAHAHVVFADREPDKAMSDPCLRLAKLYSIAVDFPRTGVPAEIPRDLRVQDYPDFMEKPDKTFYKSERVIGKLFRAVKDVAPHSIISFTEDVSRESYDLEMEVEGFQDYLEQAFDCKTEYDYKLGNLMDYYGIKTEAEIFSGSIMKMSKSFDWRKDAEDVGLAVKSLRKEARAWFEDGDNADIYAKASAWYYVTYHHSYWGCYNTGMKRDHFISFPWCVYDKLMQIKRGNRTSQALEGLSIRPRSNIS